MTQLFVSFSIAAVMTAIFAFRFQTWRRPPILCAYFALFFTVEWLAEWFLLPPDVFGVEVGIICLILALVFSLVIWVTQHFGGFDSEDA